MSKASGKPRKLTSAQFTLIDMRRTLGLTQKELAEELGFAVITIAKLETVRSPSGQTLIDLRNFAHAKNLPDHEAAFELELRGSVVATDGVVERSSLPGAPLPRTIPYDSTTEMEYMLAGRLMVKTNQKSFAKALKEVRMLLQLFSPNDPGDVVLFWQTTRPHEPGEALRVLKAARKSIEEKREKKKRG
jgi:transcriptional regulator with XRE-family HTH domain